MVILAVLLAAASRPTMEATGIPQQQAAMNLAGDKLENLDRQSGPRAGGGSHAPEGLFCSRAFFAITICILGLTAASKFITAAGGSVLLTVPDPVMPIPLRFLLILAASIETCIIVFLTRPKYSNFWKAASVAWLGGCFLIYKGLLWVRDAGHPCSCLGWLGKWLLLSERSLTIITTIFAAFFVLGGLAIMTLEGIKRRACPK